MERDGGTAPVTELASAGRQPRAADEAGPGRSQSIAGGSARMLVFRVLTAISDFLTLVVTARGFGAAGRGQYALASFSTSVGVTLMGGYAVSLSAEFAHRRAERANLYAATLALTAIAASLAAFAALLLILLLPADTEVVAFGAAAMPFAILVVLLQGLLQAEGELKRLQLLTLGASVVPLAALSIVAIAAPGHIYTALAAWVIAQPVTPCAVLAVQARHHGLEWSRLLALTRRLTITGLPVCLANAIQLLNYRIDLIVVTALLPLSDVGLYSIAIGMAEGLLILSRSLGTGAYSRIITNDNTPSASLTARTIRHAILMLSVVGVIAAVVSQVLFAPVFGEQFAKSAPPFALLLPGIVALGAGELTRPFLLVRLERSRDFLISAIGAMLINLTLAVLLVPAIGLLGAALSTSVSYLCGACFLGWRFRRMSPDSAETGLTPGLDEVRDYRELIKRRRNLGSRSGN